MKKIFKNTAILYVAQVAGVLIPVLEVPILARSLGPENYGSLVFVQSVALICSLLVEFGFNLSAARKVAVLRGSSECLKALYINVSSAKIILSVLGSIFYFGVYFAVDLVGVELFLIGYMYFLAFGFSPIWLFQGLEKLGFVIYFEVFLRFLSLAALYFFVVSESDTLLAMGVLAITGLLNTVVGNIYSAKILVLSGFKFDLREGIEEIKQGYNMFIYRSSNNILLSSGPPLVGFVSYAGDVANYSAAEKVVKGLSGFLNPFLLAIFPHLSAQISGGKGIRSFSIYCCGISFLVGVVFSMIVFHSSETIVDYLLGEGFDEAVLYLQLFCLILPFRMLSQSLGVTVFLPLGKDRQLGMLVIVFTVSALFMAMIFAQVMGGKGVVLGFILAEVGLVFSLLLALLFGGRS